jgi:peroxiredoxin
MKKIGLILVVFTFLINNASAGQSPEVGDSAPDFSLVDVSGNDVRLSDFKGKKNVVLVFYQWHSCRRCREQLSELQENISEIIKLNSELIAISSAGDRDNVERTKSALGITFTLIPIPNKKVVLDFGLTYTGGGRVHAVIIIDKKGRVRYKSVDKWPTLTKTSTIIKELQTIQ